MNAAFLLHSGNHKLTYKNGETEVIENGHWQGTIVYMEISTSREINPNDLVAFRVLNPFVERSVLVALQRRYKVLNGSDKE